jgi:hypothetical protein
MKKIAALSIALLSIIPTSSHASTTKSVAIIDTGVLSTFQHSNIIHETCISNSNYPSCPNGQVTQDGGLSADLTPAQFTLTNASHGTEMLAAANSTGNIPVVFIRASSFNGNNLYLPSESQLVSSLVWVYQNASTYNIGAVSLSMGSLVSNCSYDAQMVSAINNLKSIGIPLVASAGNNSIYTQIQYPACLKPTIAIGGIDQYGLFALWSNYSSVLDFAAQGVFDAYINGVKYHEVGNSASTAIFAADWVLIQQSKPKLTYDQEYALIKNTATMVSSTKVKNVPAINLVGAIK